MKIRKQKSCESCLSVCLMSILKYQKGIKLNDEEEFKILLEGVKFTRLDFSTGHLVYLAKKFPRLIFEQYVDFDIFYRILNKLKKPKNLKLYPRKIDLKFLKEMVKENFEEPIYPKFSKKNFAEISFGNRNYAKFSKETPIIIYIDLFSLERIYHYSHFVILKSIDDEKAIIFDPWSGKKIEMKTKILMRSISYLRNMLKISPKLIRIK